ncbi:MAG: sigma-70 family RNA polymerase sigma factor [Clostridiales bacterium]|jgi:RNA polymerase sigma factor (sigma-70 family)|nr:sigma-70 family RNA polymerase sigma factor [Clostridiales bacterium]
MKKHRKQAVYVYGEKRFADVPVDRELYKADNHEEYQRVRNKKKHIPLSVDIPDGFNLMEAYEEAQLIEQLNGALQTLAEKERRLIEYYFFEGLTEQEIAAIFKVTHQTINKNKRAVVNKLRDILTDWINP